jgi:hypothetical protein
MPNANVYRSAPLNAGLQTLPGAMLGWIVLVLNERIRPTGLCLPPVTDIVLLPVYGYQGNPCAV